MHQTGYESIYIGASTKANADGEQNEIVLGYNVTGGGANTVTIGNTSITRNIFNGTMDIAGDVMRIRTSKTPASATAAGNEGDICRDSSYIYVCTATNTWKRASLSTW